MTFLFCCNATEQFTRHCEHSMHVARGQQFPLPRLEPAQSGVALALRSEVPSSHRVMEAAS